MKKQRRWVSVMGVTVLALAGLAACGDTPAEPNLSVELEREEARSWRGLELEVLERRVPVARAAARGWIGPAGGELEVGGVALRIPAGALDRRHLIVLVVPAGRHVQAHLFPHGLEFERPVDLAFSLEGTSVEGDPTGSESLVGVYFERAIRGGLVEVEELVPAEYRDGSIVLEIEHFSGYTPAGG